MRSDPVTGEPLFDMTWIGLDVNDNEVGDPLVLTSVNYTLQHGANPSVATVAWDLPWPVLNADDLKSKTFRASDEGQGGAMEGAGASESGLGFTANLEDGIEIEDEILEAYLRTIPRYGNLHFDDGVEEIVLKQCAVDGPIEVQRSTGGVSVNMRILDRRWRWASKDTYTDVITHYNRRNGQGDVILDGNHKTIEWLCDYLISNVDSSTNITWAIEWFSGAPFGTIFSELFPEDFWWADGLRTTNAAGLETDAIYPEIIADNPDAISLVEELCNRYNMRLYYNPNYRSPEGTISERIEIRKLRPNIKVIDVFYANDLNDIAVQSKSMTQISPIRPVTLKVVGGFEEYEKELLLEPVGLDTDGKIKIIPDEGVTLPNDDYTSYGYAGFQEGEAEHITEKTAKRRLADRCTFRWYRIVEPATIGSSDYYRDGFDIIKKLSDMVDYAEGGVEVLRPTRPYVFGTHWEEMDTHAAGGENSAATDQVDVPFTIDSAKKIVKFSKPVYQMSLDLGTRAWLPGDDLTLKAVYRVKDTRSVLLTLDLLDVTNDKGNYIFVGDSAPTYPLEILRVEHFRWLYSTGGVAQNAAAIIAEATLIATEYAQRWAAYERGHARFIGNHSIQPNGSIHEITWSISITGGSFTDIGINSERSITRPRYNERVAIAKLRSNVIDEQWQKTIKQMEDITTPEIRNVDN